MNGVQLLLWRDPVHFARGQTMIPCLHALSTENHRVLFSAKSGMVQTFLHESSDDFFPHIVVPLGVAIDPVA